ncbi:MAG TPA: Wzy polymerase domain-containing protein [Rhodocyclaceae bacterium]
MSSPTPYSDRLALLFVAASVSLPFLQPIHSPPITSFYSEWLAVAFGLLALFSVTLGGAPRIPRLALWPLAFVVLIALQGVQGTVANGGMATLACIYLIWAACMMSCSATLAARTSADTVASAIATGLVVGATISALIALASLTGINGIWLARQAGAMSAGNLAQKNHLAQLLWLGIASLGYLHWRRGLPSGPALALLLLLATVSLLTGARATLLYAAWCSLLLWGWGQRRQGVGLIVVYTIALVVLPKLITLDPGGDAASRIATAAANLGGNPQLIDARWQVLGEAWRMFLDAPLGGVGFGGFSWHAFVDQINANAQFASGENAHNLFAQIAAEFGLPGLILLAGGLLVALRFLGGVWRESPYRWVVACLGIQLIHSQLEYPLWYAYFLGVFSLLLGLLPQHEYALRLPRWVWAGALLAGGFVAFDIGRDHVMLESAVNAMPRTEAQFRARNQILTVMSRYSLLGVYADSTLVASAPPISAALAEKRTLCRKTLTAQPSAPGIFHCALFEELAGCHHTSEQLWALGGRSFPAQRDYVADALRQNLRAEDLQPLLPRLSADAAPPAAPDQRADCRFPGL